jgi:hypothetical protein
LALFLSKGQKLAEKKRHHHEGSYEGMKNRRHMEMQDAGMIRENHSEVANMPQDVKYTSWPKAEYGMIDSDLDDTIKGINRQMDRDEDQGKRHMRPHKY